MVVRAVPGSAFDLTAVAETIEGADVVLSALGANSLRREDVLERAVPRIVAAMQQQGVRRIIVLGSAGAKPGALDKQPAWRRWLVEHLVYKTLLKWPVASQRSQYATLSASGLDWTMVMPPMLTHGHGRGKWRTDPDALPRNASRISREDVADFMMQQIDSPEWIGKAVYLSW
jgi:putative NADH-flavin reductase